MKIIAAIPYGKDGLSGDSTFYPGSTRKDDPETYVLCKGRMSFKALLQKWKDQNPEAGEEPVGFWLVTAPQWKKLCFFSDCLPEAGGDGQCYSNNRARKTFLNAIALHVGKEAIPYTV